MLASLSICSTNVRHAQVEVERAEGGVAELATGFRYRSRGRGTYQEGGERAPVTTVPDFALRADKPSGATSPRPMIARLRIRRGGSCGEASAAFAETAERSFANSGQLPRS